MGDMVKGNEEVEILNRGDYGVGTCQSASILRKRKAFLCTGDLVAAPRDGAEKVGRELPDGGYLSPQSR